MQNISQLLKYKIFMLHTFTKILKNTRNILNMDHGNGQSQEEERIDQLNMDQNAIMVRYQVQPIRDVAVDEMGGPEYLEMHATDDNSMGSVDDGNNVAAGDDYDVSDHNSTSSEEFDMFSEMDSEYGIHNIVQLHKYFIKRRESKKPAYAFQPLRLLKCVYKSLHDSWAYPIARSGHRITASESHLYSLGGYNPNRRTDNMRRGECALFQELWAYNFATNRWKLIQNPDNTDMPRELASNALIIYKNVLISHGGTGFPFGEICSNDCYVYTTGENPKISLLRVSGDLPAAQYGPGIVIHKDYLYTVGGTTGFDYSCDVYRLNLITKVWENVYICRPDMRDDPEGRYRHEVAYDGGHIYVLGGGTAQTVYDLKRIPGFNLETNRWDYFETFPDRTASTSEDHGYPRARKCLSCVQHTLSNGDIEAFITGGLQGDFATYFSDIWKLNLRTKQWFKIQNASFPRPLYFHSAAHAGNGCMYIFGGIEYSEKDMCRRNDLFKIWMTIPKLSDICWDAITYYNTNLHHYNRSTLLRAGIPDRYVNRLPSL